MNPIGISELSKPFGIHPVESVKLEGYDSTNFRIEDSAGRRFVLKHYLDPTERPFVAAEIGIIRQLADRVDFALPIPLPAGDSWIHTFEDQSFARMTPYIPGTFLAETRHTDHLVENVGRAAGSLLAAAQDLASPVIAGRRLCWDLQHALLNQPKRRFITDPARARLVDTFFDLFEHQVLPELPFLRHSVIHSDLNDWNVLTDGRRVTGLIDFGDISVSPAIHEVAIALTYLMFGKPDPLATAGLFIRGCCEAFPLTRPEISLLYYLIPARLAVSVCNSAEKKADGGESEYILISERPAWQLLETWVRLNPAQVEKRLLTAAGFVPDDPEPGRERTAGIRQRHTGPCLGLSYKEPIHMTGALFQYMYDSSGNTFLDAYNNVPHVGHAHPAVSRAVSTQVRRLNTNTRYLVDTLADYTERLLALLPAPLDTVFFVNSGSMAADLAVRIARTVTGRRRQLVLEHGYHGNTIAGISISSYKFDGRGGPGRLARTTLLPLPTLFNGRFDTARAYVDHAAGEIEKLVADGDVPAFLIAEPVSGCGGQVPLAAGYLKGLEPTLRRHGILLILDEVQTGFGRLGTHFWGFEAQGVVPDLVLLGKPMGNGLPIAAVVTTQKIAAAFSNGMEFFSSFGGNPVSCQAALAVLDVLETEGLQQNALVTGRLLLDGLNDLKRRFPVIGDVRGSGLFLGIEFVSEQTGRPDPVPAGWIKESLRQRFILTGTDGPQETVLKIKPPLCFDTEDAARFLSTLEDLLRHLPIRNAQANARHDDR